MVTVSVLTVLMLRAVDIEDYRLIILKVVPRLRAKEKGIKSLLVEVPGTQ